MLAPYLLGQRGPGAYLGVGGGGGGGGGSDGGFVDEPIATTTAAGVTTINGKVKPGSFGKFVYPLASIAAGRIYTFRYTPHFSQLTLQGKLAMVGFGLKNNNDFNLVGLRGDGTTGLRRYKVNGTPPNGWNKQTGHTTTDGGASTNGTQAGPNYIRLITSVDGTTLTFATSGDSGTTWIIEFSIFSPTPFTNISTATTFGIALWFNNADTGNFSIDIDQFADAADTPSFTLSGAIVKNTVDKTTQNYSAGVAMTFSAEDADTAAIHDTGSNTGRLTIPAGLNGKYGIIHANVSLALLNLDQDYWCIINKSGGGNANFVGAGMRANSADATVTSGTAYFAVQTHPLLLNTADYYEVSVYCNDTSVTLVAATTAFSIYVVG